MSIEADILEALVRTIEMKDLCTASHTWRVVLYSRAMADKMRYPAETVLRLSNAAALHDLGKIDIPDEILRKPSALTPQEYDVMKSHTVFGHSRLVRMGEDDPMLLGIVRHHHERVDGTGYPDRLTHDQIPWPAKWFAVVDSFDAMTSVRPYHTEFGKSAAKNAMEILHKDAGTHYCPVAVELFSSVYESGDLDWVLNNFHNDAQLPSYSTSQEAQAMLEKFRTTAH